MNQMVNQSAVFIAIVDDHEVIINGLKAMLAAEKELEIPIRKKRGTKR